MSKKPKVLKGFRDLLPDEMIARERMIAVIREVYESYGFSPFATPAMEPKEVLVGLGEEANKQIYLFEEPDGNEVGLRFDLTAPLGRVMAIYRDLPRPFKRYQIQPVWRYDKPDPGRFREFLQFDIDTIGTRNMLADTEIMVAIQESFTALGLRSCVRFSSRKILNSLLRYAGIPDEMAYPVFRKLDKLDKQGLDAVKLELGAGRLDESGDKIEGLNLENAQIEKIEQFLKLPQNTREEALKSVTDLFRDVDGAAEGLTEIKQICNYLGALEISDDAIALDLSIARGLDYYTGPVFEAVLLDKGAADVGSVMGGGRYDDLIGRFTGEPVPATGASIGVDRLLAAIRQMKQYQPRSSTADVLVTVMDKNRITDYLKLARLLRSEGINTELYTGKIVAIGKQLKYADKLGIPVAVIAGSDEFENDQVSIKDLEVIKQQEIDIKERGEWVEKKVGQKTVPMSDLVKEVRTILTRE